MPCGFDGPLLCFSEQVLEFGKDLFDGVEIRTVGRQKEQPCANRCDGGPDGIAFVGQTKSWACRIL